MLVSVFLVFSVHAHRGHDHAEQGFDEKISASFRITNMYKAESAELSVQIGEKSYWDAISIELIDCMALKHDQNNYWAHIKLVDKADNVRFEGWINSRFASASPINDPTYDVWLKECK